MVSFCTACGTELTPGARFCAACGTPVVRPAAPPVEQPGERRQVTLLFADLCDYTRITSERDPEEMHGLMGALFQELDAIVLGYGGTVIKHHGDLVMAAFGAVIAHTDDPERAARAALDFNRAIDAMGRRVGLPLALRIGVASGEVVVEKGAHSGDMPEYLITGIAANLASRLESMANPGEIIVSDAVHLMAGGRLDCALVGEVSVKGLSGPVTAWRLLGLKRPTERPPSSAFVGRRSERDLFQAALGATLRTRRGQPIYVRGDAGIGKSRLVEEFSAIAKAGGFLSHRVQVFDFGVKRGDDAIGLLLRSLLDLPLVQDGSDLAPAVEQAIETGAVSAERRAFLYDLLDLPLDADARALYDAMSIGARLRGQHAVLADAVSERCARQPRLMIVEDVHWADPTTLAHLAAIAAAAVEAPAILVLSSRSDADPLDSTWRHAAGGALSLTMDLTPLRPEEATEMARQSFGAGADIIADCVSRANGNPLFLEQLLRDVTERGLSSLPASIQSVVQARLDRLPNQDKRALQAASVIGQRFGLDLLAQLTGDVVDDGLLVGHDLVRPDGDAYLFNHALIREGIYLSLLKRVRQDLHHKAAAWFADRDAALHAEHLAKAEDRGAAEAYLAAILDLERQYQSERALDLADRALELERQSIGPCELTLAKAKLLRDLGRFSDSIDAFQKALTLCQTDRDRVRALIGMAAAMRQCDRIPEALAALDQAAPLADHGATALERVQLHHNRGGLLYATGALEACMAEHRLALEHAQAAGLAEQRAFALSGLGDAHYATGRMATALRHFEDCLALCARHGFRRIEAANRFMTGTTRFYLNELDRSLSDSLSAAEASVQVGERRAEIIARLTATLVYISRGAYDAGREEAEKALSLAREIKARRFEPVILTNLARMDLAQGDAASARRLLDQALTRARSSGMEFAGPWVLATHALLVPDPAARARGLQEGESLLAAGSLSHNHYWFHQTALASALTRGDWTEAEQRATALRIYTADEPTPWATFRADWGAALASYGRDGPDASQAPELKRLAEEARRQRLAAILAPLERAIAGLPLGQVLP